jgi:hypothetical protein
MSGPLTIQRVPRGLLYALAMKGSGDTPTQLRSEVQGSFDLTALYFGDAQRSLTATSPVFNTDSNNDFAALIVPAGELWILTALTLERSNVLAGTNFDMWGFYARGTTGFVQIITDKATVTGGGAGTSDGICAGRYGLLDIVLYPNDRIGVAVRNGTWGAAQQATAALDFYRLEI